MRSDDLSEWSDDEVRTEIRVQEMVMEEHRSGELEARRRLIELRSHIAEYKKGDPVWIDRYDRKTRERIARKAVISTVSPGAHGTWYKVVLILKSGRAGTGQHNVYREMNMRRRDNENPPESATPPVVAGQPEPSPR